jgi:inorganic phosphate transporter, PiT family
MEWMLAGAALLLAYANGANDNFKGFATVYGSGVASFRTALLWATVATVAGSLAALWLAQGLVAGFSGRGLVPASLAGTMPFLFAVAAGAGFTVLLATFLGMPISTTHALIGGLTGAGLAAPGGQVAFAKLGQSFLLPLLLSPLLSATLAYVIYSVIRRRGVEKVAQGAAAQDACVCVPAQGTSGSLAGAANMGNVSPVVWAATGVLPAQAMPAPAIVGTTQACADAGAQPIVSVRGWLEKLHYASAVAICFARGVNDAPKLVALLIAAKLAGTSASFAWLAVAMAIGGWIGSRKVAETMSKKVTPLTPVQGTAANWVTACLVLAASKFSLPVSTTHVSVGSISGAGLASGTLDKAALGKILLSWVFTLPIAAASAALAMRLA